MSPTYPFTNLVFEGGGVKGIAYAGALQVLEEADILTHVAAVAGTSAGAITAALVASGYTAAELAETMLALDFSRFEDGHLEGPVRLIEEYGWYRGEAFLEWLRAQVEARLGSAKITFAELANARHIDLRVVATDVAAHTPQVFSTATTPDVEVAQAVRMSMSIPFFFAAVRANGRVYVDGGAAWNYPVEIFDGEIANTATLGFHLDNPGPPPPPAEIHDVVGFAKCLYESLMAVQDDFFERSLADRERTVRIDDLGLRATDFSLTTAQKEALIGNGATATRAYLAAYVPVPGASG